MATRFEKSLPPILRRRVKNEEEASAAVAELFKYVELDESVPLDQLYRAFAQALVRKMIPAFKPKRRTRADAQALFELEWIEAGGTIGLLGLWTDPTAFYQAQFVQRVEALKAEHSSRMGAFKWLAFETAMTGGLKEKERRLKLLPRPYRARRTAGSLKQAFDKIPKAVRSAPNAFLPARRPTVSGFGECLG